MTKNKGETQLNQNSKVFSNIHSMEQSFEEKLIE